MGWATLASWPVKGLVIDPDVRVQRRTPCYCSFDKTDL
jgi:hypothetical protein